MLVSEALYRTAVRWRKVRAYAVPFSVRVSTNLVLDDMRRSKQRQSIATIAETRIGEPETQLDLAECLRSLPDRQRDVVTLRYLAGFSEAETAAALGIAPGTVKSHASRGLGALRVLLEPASIATRESR